MEVYAHIWRYLEIYNYFRSIQGRCPPGLSAGAPTAPQTLVHLRSAPPLQKPSRSERSPGRGTPRRCQTRLAAGLVRFGGRQAGSASRRARPASRSTQLVVCDAAVPQGADGVVRGIVSPPAEGPEGSTSRINSWGPEGSAPRVDL